MTVRDYSISPIWWNLVESGGAPYPSSALRYTEISCRFLLVSRLQHHLLSVVVHSSRAAVDRTEAPFGYTQERQIQMMGPEHSERCTCD